MKQSRRGRISKGEMKASMTFKQHFLQAMGLPLKLLTILSDPVCVRVPLSLRLASMLTNTSPAAQHDAARQAQGEQQSAVFHSHSPGGAPPLATEAHAVFPPFPPSPLIPSLVSIFFPSRLVRGKRADRLLPWATLARSWAEWWWRSVFGATQNDTAG